MLQWVLDLEGKRNPLQWSEQTVMPHKGNICKNGNSFFRPHSGIRVRYTSDKQAILNLCLGIWESEMHSWQAKSHHTSLLRNRQSPNKRPYYSYSNNYYTYLYVYVYLPSEHSCGRKLCKKIAFEALWRWLKFSTSLKSLMCILGVNCVSTPNKLLYRNLLLVLYLSCAMALKDREVY